MSVALSLLLFELVGLVVLGGVFAIPFGFCYWRYATRPDDTFARISYETWFHPGLLYLGMSWAPRIFGCDILQEFPVSYAQCRTRSV